MIDKQPTHFLPFEVATANAKRAFNRGCYLGLISGVAASYIVQYFFS